MKLDELLRSGNYPNASSAAVALEVVPRTIHRDLDFLRDSLGAPLEFSHKHNGYYYRDKDFALPLFRISEGEVVALFLAERLMQQYQGTPYANLLASVFGKLTAQLENEVTIDLRHLQQSFSVRPSPVAGGDAELFDRLSRAVQAGQRLEMVYWTASTNATRKRIVDPYHLASVAGDWYLIAYCHWREDVLMFVPSRIRSLREMEERFERPADFRIEEYLDHSFRAVRGDGAPQRIRLRFAPEAAKYVRERTWHPSQKSQLRRDGSLIVTLQLNHTLEVKRWVLSYGAGCEVLEPAELRREVQEELRRTISQYDPDSQAVASTK
jgi:predicted DNA-binding transcriptional regulator YafY